MAEGARACITARKPEPLQDAAGQFPEGSVIAVAGKADVGEAMRLFHFSITYLTALFVLMAVDVLVRYH